MGLAAFVADSVKRPIISTTSGHRLHNSHTHVVRMWPECDLPETDLRTKVIPVTSQAQFHSKRMNSSWPQRLCSWVKCEKSNFELSHTKKMSTVHLVCPCQTIRFFLFPAACLLSLCINLFHSQEFFDETHFFNVQFLCAWNLFQCRLEWVCVCSRMCLKIVRWTPGNQFDDEKVNNVRFNISRVKASDAAVVYCLRTVAVVCTLRTQNQPTSNLKYIYIISRCVAPLAFAFYWFLFLMMIKHTGWVPAYAQVAVSVLVLHISLWKFHKLNLQECHNNKTQ